MADTFPLGQLTGIISLNFNGNDSTLGAFYINAEATAKPVDGAISVTVAPRKGDVAAALRAAADQLDSEDETAAPQEQDLTRYGFPPRRGDKVG